MYIVHSLLVKDLVHNVIKIIEKEQGQEIKIAIQSEAVFQTDEERRIFYKSFNRNKKSQRLSHGQRKVPTIYTYPLFRNQVVIHMISAQSANPEANYLTYVCQQQFAPTPGACLLYQYLRSFSAYTAETGRISVISDRVDTITSLIPQHLHQPLSAHQYYPLHITPYNLVSRMPRSASDPKPAFIQCGRHSNFWVIFGLSLPDLTPYSTAYCNIVSHYINAKLTEMGAQDLLYRVLTPDVIA